MRMAISNIAWRPDEDAAMARMLAGIGVDALEVAPTRVWPKPLEVAKSEVLAWTARQKDLGLEVVSMQALLFGRPDLAVFGDAEVRAQTLAYLVGILELAAVMGARRLVFGSPHNRHPAALTAELALEQGAAFFAQAGQRARELGVVLCVEPNPPAYGCTWITTAAQGHALVQLANEPGFGLHLDAAGMFLAGDDPAAMAAQFGARTQHFHLSAPQLGPVRRGGPVDDAAVVAALAGSGYAGLLSIEMRTQRQAGDNRPCIAETVGYVRQVVDANSSSP